MSTRDQLTAIVIALALVTAPNLVTSAMAAPASVKGIRVGEHTAKTRVVVDLTGAADALVSRAPDGLSVIADMPGADVKAVVAKGLPKSPIVSGYRVEPLPGGGARLTITGKGPIQLNQTQKVGPGEGYGHRLVFDVEAGTAPMVMMAPAVPMAQMEPVKAPSPVPEVYVMPHVGTLGFGADAGIKVHDNIGVRLTGDYFRLSRSTDVDGVHYKGDVTLGAVGVLADYHPFGNGFHVTGGAYVNFNKGDFSATPTTNVTLGSTTYTPAQAGTLRAEAEFNRIAPYLGVGWRGGDLASNLVFGAELGVMYQGQASVSLTSTGGLNTAQFQSDLEAERKNIEDELSKFRFYPVATVSVGYKF